MSFCNSTFSVVLVLLFGNLSAQHTPQPHFRNYTTEHGLPSPEVYCAFQDSWGYMWFGTDNGACRFDGYRFHTYDAEDGLMSNVVFDIHEDAKGRIWFGTMTGEIFIMDRDTIFPYRFNKLIQQYSQGLTSSHLLYLQPESETVFLKLTNLGLLKIDSLGKDSLVTSRKPFSNLIWKAEESSRVLYTSISRYESLEGEKDILYWRQYVYKNQRTLLEIIGKQGRKEYDFPRQVKVLSHSFKVQRTRDNYLLIADGQQIWCMKDKEVLWTRKIDFRCNEIIEDSHKAIWLCGAEGGGLQYYENLEALKKGEYEQFLTGLSISNMFRDIKDDLWITSTEKGVFYCNDLQLRIYNTKFGLSTDLVSAVAFQSDSKLIAGCENGAIFWIDLKENKIEKTIYNNFNHYNFDLLYQTKTDVLWSGPAYWKNERWNFVKYGQSILESGKFSMSKLEKLHFNYVGELIGCNQGGFYIIDVVKDTLKFQLKNLYRERTFAVYTSLKNQIWVGTSGGIHLFQDSVLTKPEINHPAFHTRVEDIDELPDSSLIFGTKGWGVVRWKGDDVLQLSTKDGLLSSMIEDVHVDEAGIVWVATLSGLNKITFDEDGAAHIRSFTETNGLPSNEINKIRSYGGQIWLCTSRGLVKFHEKPKNSCAVPPVIQEFKVNNALMTLAERQKFKYDENSLEFRFLAINYCQNGQIPYRYRLQKKAKWQYTPSINVNYPKLPPNDYQFEVQAQNEDGFWSDSTHLSFCILPPWWRSGWVQASALGVAFAALFFFQGRRTKQLKKEIAIQKQITELERSALQAQMSPHFIFNCLNSIQNFILTNEKKKAVEFLARFARLVRHNLDVSVNGKISLAEEVSMLDSYLALEQERFNQAISYSITVEECLENVDVQFPPLLIQPYVENAVIHGLDKEKGGGRVDIHFDREKEYLSVRIRDNGIGYRNNQEQQTSSLHKSVGMSITQQRLSILNNGVSDTVQIETLENKKGEIIGTEVRLRLTIV